MKKGIFDVLPNLVLHIIVFIVILSIIFGLIGMFLSNPENADAENELKNFASVVNAFAESDRTSDTFFFVNDKKYAMVMFDGEDRSFIKAQISGTITGTTAKVEDFLTRPETFVGPPLKNTCSQKCICVVEYIDDKLLKIACEKTKTIIRQNKDIGFESNLKGVTVLPSNKDCEGSTCLLALGKPAGKEDGFRGQLMKLEKKPSTEDFVYVLITPVNSP